MVDPLIDGFPFICMTRPVVYYALQVTEDQRQWTERKQKQAALDAQRRRRSVTRELPSLSTDTHIVNEATTAPPGKMDHATAAAFLVGGARR